MKRLDNKIAVITGGNSGIGFSTAKTFIDQGAKVAIFGRDQKTLDDAVETLGTNAIGIQGDVTNDDDLKKLFDDTQSRFGKIDIVFANAGVADFMPLEAITDEHIDKVFGINVKGTLKTVQLSLGALNDNASIILTTSDINKLGVAGSSIYAASKAAIRSMARTFSRELLERGIRVNAVAPGPVSTPIFGRMGLPEEVAEGIEGEFTSLVPLARAGKPSEIANAALFLASSESSYMVGAELVVDGGLTQL